MMAKHQPLAESTSLRLSLAQLATPLDALTPLTRRRRTPLDAAPPLVAALVVALAPLAEAVAPLTWRRAPLAAASPLDAAAALVEPMG